MWFNIFVFQLAIKNVRPYTNSMKHIKSRDWLIRYFTKLNGMLNLLHKLK